MAFIEIHKVDDCVVEQTLGSFKCQPCLDDGLRSVDYICAMGGDECVTCGLRICTPSDLIVRVASLDG